MSQTLASKYVKTLWLPYADYVGLLHSMTTYANSLHLTGLPGMLGLQNTAWHQLTACTFECAAGKRLVTGSHDKFMMLADMQGHVQRTWKAAHVHDLAISKDGRLLFCVTSEKKVQPGVVPIILPHELVAEMPTSVICLPGKSSMILTRQIGCPGHYQ